MRSRLGIEVLVGVLLAVVLVLTVLLGAPAGVRVPLGLLVTLVVPGLCAFHAVQRRPVRSLSEVAVSIAAAVGLVILLGIVLNLLPVGLTPLSWSLGLLDVTLALAAVCVLRSPERVRTTPARSMPADASVTRRRRGAPVAVADETPPPPARASVPTHHGWTDGRRLSTGLLPLALCGALLTVGAVVTVSSQRAELGTQRLTEVWLAGSGNARSVHLRNQEGIDMEYRVVVSVQGRARPAQAVPLAPDQEWVTTVDLPATARRTAGAAPVLAVAVYRSGQQAVYREVHLNRARS